MDIILEVKNLRFSYFDNEILKGIDLVLYKGEKVAVLGPNGSGKSTFFFNLNGALKKDSGEIFYQKKQVGEDKKSLNLLRKNIGIVFQDADNQIIASTVEGEISFGPMNLKLPIEEVRRRVNDAIEYMDLSKYRNTPPHYLSGGEKKRVTIADIVAMESEIIIFDEPQSSLDPLNAELFEEVIEGISKKGKTILISTHDMNFAYRWADRILVFHEGNILMDGSPDVAFQSLEDLKEVGLKKPILLEVTELLKDRGHIKKGCFPKTVEELEKML